MKTNRAYHKKYFAFYENKKNYQLQRQNIWLNLLLFPQTSDNKQWIQELHTKYKVTSGILGSISVPKYE